MTLGASQPNEGGRDELATRRPQTCFISAARATDAESIHAIVQGLGWNEIRRDDPIFGTDRTDKLIARAIRSSDVFIGILSAEDRNATVLVEAGVARGAGKTVVLIAGHGDLLPSAAAGVLVLQVSPSDSEAVSFALQNVLRQTTESGEAEDRSSQENVFTTSPSEPGFEDLLLRARQFRRPPKPRKNTRTQRQKAMARRRLLYERSVEQLFRIGGVDLVAAGSGPRPTRAIWVDALQASFGNPILVELRSQVTKRYRRDTVREILRKSGARSLLVIYLRGTAPAPSVTPDETILFVRFDRLIELMRTGSITNAFHSLASRGRE